MPHQADPTGPAPILISVDFSRDSDAAVDWGLAYAALAKLPVILFHAIHDSAEAPGFYTREDEPGLVMIEEVAQEMMAAQLKKIAPMLKGRSAPKVTTEMVEGLPAGRIVETAIARGCELIVIGSRGRTRVQSLLMGSVAETVVQKAPIPVVVVKAPRPNADSPAMSDPDETPEAGTDDDH